MMSSLPPQNVEMEQSVLGAVLQNNDIFAQLADTLQAEDFYHETHRWLFRAMLELFHDNIPIDVLSVNECLKKKDRLDAIGGPAYLAELIEYGSHGRVRRLPRPHVVRQKSVLRAVIRTANDIVAECHEEDADADELIRPRGNPDSRRSAKPRAAALSRSAATGVS